MNVLRELRAVRQDRQSYEVVRLRRGGLLLRRDLHRLFDHGLIAVNELGTVDVAEEIRKYPLYDSLHGASLTVPMTKKQTVWLQRHWQEWRAPA